MGSFPACKNANAAVAGLQRFCGV